MREYGRVCVSVRVPHMTVCAACGGAVARMKCVCVCVCLAMSMLLLAAGSVAVRQLNAVFVVCGIKYAIGLALAG